MKLSGQSVKNCHPFFISFCLQGQWDLAAPCHSGIGLPCISDLPWQKPSPASWGTVGVAALSNPPFLFLDTLIKVI